MWFSFYENVSIFVIFVRDVFYCFMRNPFVTNGYAGPEYFCDRVQETAINMVMTL